MGTSEMSLPDLQCRVLDPTPAPDPRGCWDTTLERTLKMCGPCTLMAP